MALSVQVLLEDGDTLISEDSVHLIFTEGGPVLPTPIVAGTFTIAQAEAAGDFEVAQAHFTSAQIIQDERGNFVIA